MCVFFFVAARRALAFQTATVGASSSAALSLLTIDRKPESLFVYSCFYPAGEGPFRAGYESAE
jgi:hypothetical protein